MRSSLALAARQGAARNVISRVVLGLGVCAMLAMARPSVGQMWPVPAVPAVEQGQVLFHRQWQSRDRRSLEGDGLGPLFNGRSCVACHHQGGPGGSGSPDNNVELLCLVPTEQVTRIDRRSFVAQAGLVHPAFVVDETTALPTIVFHKHGTLPLYAQWRNAIYRDLNRGKQKRVHASFRVEQFQRRTPALFGAGLIDAIPAEVLQETARLQAATAGVKGTVALATDGSIGRFGWRGQTANLRQFVFGACANELGLHVPNFRRAKDPLGMSGSVPGLDMDESQCEALVAFVSNLPPPAARQPAGTAEAQYWQAGKCLFAGAGCADCHVERLGDVTGIYSDLLLHDMGPVLSDPAGVNVPGQTGLARVSVKTPASYYGGTVDVFVAVPPEARRLWRTPPLWGLAESGPYLHDGRARTLDQAILAHAGEALASRNKYADLRQEQRARLWAYLYSLGVPNDPRDCQVAMD